MWMKKGFIRIQPSELDKFIEEKEGLILLDVRTENEFLYEGRLEGAMLLDYKKPRLFARELNQLDKNRPYLVYCAVDRISQLVCEEMVEKGFVEVYDLIGGLKLYQSENEHLTCKVSKLNDEEILKKRKSIVNRFNRMEGQIRGVKNMLQEGEYCGDILNQSLAIKSALNAANKEIIEMFHDVCITNEKERQDFFKYIKKLMG
jgi:DNA-binding FrmR family transcriptional regulator/rhodanese-related sulfurtransferase